MHWCKRSLTSVLTHVSTYSLQRFYSRARVRVFVRLLRLLLGLRSLLLAIG